jgi:8-oxo-dGTP diphosphatase
VPEPIHRSAARLIVLDPYRRVLLFRYARNNGEMFWATPGGGLEPGESFEQAAIREAGEELGISAGFSPLQLWSRINQFSGPLDHPIRQKEVFFRIEIDSTSSLPNGASVDDAHLKEGILESRWWTVAELESTTALVFPEDLAPLLRNLPGH